MNDRQGGEISAELVGKEKKLDTKCYTFNLSLKILHSTLNNVIHYLFLSKVIYHTVCRASQL